ncbi:MAG: hypothetical protein QM831_21490 [Kofleriaceae bacterium]
MKLLPLILLAGCASVGPNGNVNFETLNPPPHPMAPRAPQQVEIFEEAPPPRPHVDVGTFQIVQWGGPSPTDFRVAGANYGCDGVVLHEHRDSTDGVCIVYTDGPPM